ncbi:MAG: response regulator, partial [Planctomycetota bacterium]
VLLAENGIEALNQYYQFQDSIDLVILDIVMPTMDGREAFYQIKEVNPAVKILISSGFSRDRVVNELLAAGAVGFIQKPFQRVELSHAVAMARSAEV